MKLLKPIIIGILVVLLIEVMGIIAKDKKNSCEFLIYFLSGAFSFIIGQKLFGELCIN